MKYRFILFSILTFYLTSCTEDKFSGSPIDNQEIINLEGVVTTTADFALAGQEIDYTATIPASFRELYADTVYVEATTLTEVGSIRKSKVTILPNQLSGTGKINVGGGVGNLFNSSFELYLSAIKLNNEIVGKHFLLNSNKLNINSGSTTIPVDNDKGMTVQFSWKNVTSPNRIQLRTYRDKSSAFTFRKTFSSGSVSIKVNNINYSVPFNTSRVQTALDFVSIHSANLNLQNIVVTASGESLLFNFVDNSYPNLTVSPASAGSVFRFADYNPPADSVKDFLIYKEQKLNSNGSFASEGSLSAFNPGEYIFTLGVLDATQLEVNPTPSLEYRCVVKFPDKSVQIFDGVLENLSPTIRENFKPVFKVVKSGIGDSATYSVTNLN